MVWATEHYYDLLGTSFFVRCEWAPLGHAVRWLLQPFLRASCGVPGRRRYSLTAGRGDAGNALYGDCSTIARHESPFRLVEILLSVLNRQAIDEFDGFAVHAGVVAHDGGVVAFPADSGDGKSTMTAACLNAGFEYVSDEALCVEFRSGRVVPYAKPIMLSEASRALLSLERSPVRPSGDADEMAFLPEELGSSTATGSLHLADVVMLARAEGALRLERLPPAEAVALLLRMSFNHYKRPRQAFELVTALAQGSRIWRLAYDHPGPAAELLRARLTAPVSPPARRPQ